MFTSGSCAFMLVVVLVVLLSITAKQSRRDASLTRRKQCRQCGARYGVEAQYCGRCGHAL